MESSVTSDQLKTLLLKCVGSKYPVRIRFTDHQERSVFVKGFEDASCNKVTVTYFPAGSTDTVDVEKIKSIRTMKLLTLERLKGCNFSVN